MTHKKIRYVTLPLVCVAGFATMAHGTADTSRDVRLPALSRAQVQQTLEQGVDISKVNTAPGLHVVPLSESWSTPDQAEIERKQIEQQRSRGFYSAEAGEVVDVRGRMKAAATERGKMPRHDRAFRSLNDVRKDLLVNPAELGTSELSSATLMEVRLGGSYVNGKWTGLARTFEVPGLGLIVLNETDHAAGNESVTLIREWMNIDVNGQSGTTKTARDASGRTLVTVGWVNERKIYSMRLQPLHPEAHEANQARLLEIARNLIET
ncbi:hypothetical protein J2T07_002030 [Luteibacter jiangsuensis]|uniref:Uncharacterized protein n=1 Tax=Luteibacter jiangsuensis TaxID=637577 RepID=A0ABT9SXW1_9GAMM|nr:hypothetical protein [Luteibacter jiangsuensis]MDQ0009840.1 hypothetical protein [Luteibacter jiangsuensis]